MKSITKYIGISLLMMSSVIGQSQITLQQFEDFIDNIVSITDGDFETYERTLVAKAQPDECFFDIGDDNNTYNPAGVDCATCEAAGGQGKVNQAYVWGLAESRNQLWYGTAPNVHCLVIGGFLGITSPVETSSYACEFGDSGLPVPGAIGDWRPPRMFRYDKYSEVSNDITPPHPLVSTTLGIRSAGATEDVVIFAGPSLLGGINLFFFNPIDGSFISAINVPEFNNIRKWYLHEDVLYAGVGIQTGGGAIVRFTGNLGAPLEVVGALDSEGAEIEFHEGRLYVTTWPNFSSFVGMNPIQDNMSAMEPDIAAAVEPGFAGLYMGPVVPPGGYTAGNIPGWTKVWDVTDYEPDTLTALTYGGGAIASYGGKLHWGTMHVPFLSTLVHFNFNSGGISDGQEAIAGVLGTHRSISIFSGEDFETTPQFELLYGLPILPVYDVNTDSWDILPNNMGATPTYGLSGFGNPFNNYTWTMEVFDDQLFVGTMDHSYLLLGDVLPDELPMTLPFDCESAFGMGDPICDSIAMAYDILMNSYDPTRFFGADLWRFPAPGSAAIPESFAGVGNHLNYGIRTMIQDDNNLYLGMANPMNLEVDCDLADGERPITGGFELIRLGAPPIEIPTMTQWGLICLSVLMMIFGLISVRNHSKKKVLS